MRKPLPGLLAFFRDRFSPLRLKTIAYHREVRPPLANPRYVRDVPVLSLRKTQVRRRLSPLRLTERLPEVVMLAGLVILGGWAHDLLDAAATGSPRLHQNAQVALVQGAGTQRETKPVDERFAVPSMPAADVLQDRAALIPAAVVKLVQDGASAPDGDSLPLAVTAAVFDDEAARPAPRAPASRDPILAGTWGPDASACNKKTSARTGMIPMSISPRGARAGDTSCTFANVRQNGSTWDVTANCGKGRERWTSKVRLTMKGDRLIWSSQKGVSDYVRCDRLMVAGR